MPAPRDRPDAAPDAPRFAVSCVVTAFAPTADLLDHLRALTGQVDRIVLVDDGSGPAYDAVLADAAAMGVDVVRLPRNLGIAAALNAGVRALLDDASGSAPAPDGIVFFDQDSRVGPGFVRAVADAHVAASRDGLPVAAAVPEFFADVSQVHGEQGPHLIARRPIQSGMLVAAVALRAIGPFREDLFIDLVDTEFSMRAEVRGFIMVAARGLDLPHELGRRVGIRVLRRVLRTPSGRPMGFTVSAPFRYYYRARNRVAVNRIYRRRLPLTVARATLLEMRHYVIVWLAVRDRREFTRILRAGRADGRAGRMGRIPDAVAEVAARIDWRVPQ
ncbi:rhamnosyltransferase [Microbacterium sp. cf046]|uniref:glycosyltransferase n=1 Tax=Microbacterium sp. cf046 TaxID=1761803 RepID=UPI0008F2A11C|nr:glycosyltransferase [Microbacterium sp. cf046]SFR95772.1 rhamnosyltransferase [Microbacterium sp. cf046]